MYKLLSVLFAGFLVLSAEAFILDSLLGGCHSDADCSDGCCIVKTSGGLFGGRTGSCQHFLLPGASCYLDDKYHCGCTAGNMCEAADSNGLALEAGSKVEGYCKPSNSSTGGPQIAVEGGR